MKERYDFSPVRSPLLTSQYPMIVGHVSPDADAVGSALALAAALRQLGKEPQVVFKDPIPDALCFLPGAENIATPETVEPHRDLLVMVDCASPKRIGRRWSEPWLEKLPVIAIDHHETNDGYDCAALVDPRAAANSQIIYYLLRALGAELTLEIATCLFTGISGDTGGFRFSNTNQETMEIGGRLMALGVNTQQVRIQLFECKSMTDMAMIGTSLRNLRQSADGKLVWTTIRMAEKEVVQATDANCENISGYTMYPKGVRVGIFFQEMPEGYVKISMRCRDGYNVARVAKAFDGGGHVAAAGCRVRGALAEVQRMVLSAAREMILSVEARGAEPCQK